MFLAEKHNGDMNARGYDGCSNSAGYKDIKKKIKDYPLYQMKVG